jgi:hypothetical protein
VLWKSAGNEATTVASFAAGTAIQVAMRSFEALVAAVLYFDLKGRLGEPAAASSAPVAAAVEGRTPGWYIDPAQPTRMRYWSADGKWNEHTAKTPKPMLREWQERPAAEQPAPATSMDEDTGHSLDPGVYTDAGRPPGWYVDPDKPWRMRYWRTDRGWSKETTKTPKQALSEWRDLRWRR